jgi:hypothetical protein
MREQNVKLFMLNLAVNTQTTEIYGANIISKCRLYTDKSARTIQRSFPFTIAELQFLTGEMRDAQGRESLCK